MKYKGVVDPEIIHVIKTMNKLPWLQTKYCCAGFGLNDDGIQHIEAVKKTGYICHPYVWFNVNVSYDSIDYINTMLKINNPSLSHVDEYDVDTIYKYNGKLVIDAVLENHMHMPPNEYNGNALACHNLTHGIYYTEVINDIDAEYDADKLIEWWSKIDNMTRAYL